jgi:hypothetical protein
MNVCTAVWRFDAERRQRPLKLFVDNKGYEP